MDQGMTVIAIVGSGALGTYAMERLAALARHEVIDASSVEILLLNVPGALAMAKCMTYISQQRIG